MDIPSLTISSDDGFALTDENITEILWTELSIAGGEIERLTFTAIVNPMDSSDDYKNVAEVVGANEGDIDSTPNNDDGDQSEDDEDFAEIEVVAATIDLELVKTSSLGEAIPGQEVSYNLNLSNRSMTLASGIEVIDILPDGLDINSISNISNGGSIDGNRIIWSDLEMGFLSSMNLSYSISVGSDVSSGDIINTAQITAANQPDIDSTPNNDDGDQSEDDEASASVEVLTPFIDLSIEKEVNNSTPQVGEFVRFEILVTNDGLISATGVSLADMIPLSGYDIGSLTNMEPAGEIIGNTILWSEYVIEPGNDLAFSFEIAVLPDGGDYKNVAQIATANEQDIDSDPNNDDGDQSEDDEDFAVVMPIDDLEVIDLELSKTVSDLQPAFGDQIIYLVTILNNGQFDATNVVVRDVTPDGIDALDVTGPNLVEDGVITWTIPVILVGQSMTFQYSSIVFESLEENYTNVVQVIEADQLDIDSAPNNDDGDQSEDDEDSATIFPVIESFIDLELTKIVEEPCAGLGERVSFTIDIINISEVIATNVSVQDAMSDGFRAISDVSYNGSVDGKNINWSGISLLPGEFISLSYSVELDIDGTSFTNIAQITGADQQDIDSTPANDDGDQSEDDEDAVTLNPDGTVDLELQKLVDDPFTPPGQRVRFDLIISNNGCEDATGVGLQDIIPSGYRAIGNISDGGERNGNVIFWEGLNIDAGTSTTVSFTAEVVHYTINCDYVNVAEIIAIDQEDNDSTPNNDDGDQSEDDEDSAEVFAGSTADIELSMAADRTEVITGDIMNCTIRVCNNGPANATNVEIRNYLPEGVRIVGDLNYKGVRNGSEITWSNFTFVAGDCLELLVNLEILQAASTREIVNIAEVVLSDQLDPDSNPGNGANGAAEDDYAEVFTTHLVPALAEIATSPAMSEVKVNTALFLEGAFNSLSGQMNTTLNKLGYLPGQKPISFFAEMTPPVQPYGGAPWHYDGNEGKIYNSQNEGSIDYPEDAVDWVLISLRSNKTAESTVVTRAALLLKDGSIMGVPDSEPILIDATQVYYLAVQHRNHLPIMSPEKISVVDGSLSFDFRHNKSFTGLLGSGQKDINGIYCVFAANGDQFSRALSANDINIKDIDEWYQKNGFNSAYMNADFDMNGDVNVNDQIIWLYNNGIFSDVPR